MKTFSISIVLSLCLVWCGTSCNKEEADETEPTVDYVLINGTNIDVSVAAGIPFTITAGFSDGTALNQVRVEVANLIEGTSGFSSVKIYDITGTNDEGSYTVDLPDTVASGPHILEVMAMDQDGNQSDTFELYFDITTATQPVVNLTAPDFSEVLNYNAGDTVVFAGTVTDDVDTVDYIPENLKALNAEEVITDFISRSVGSTVFPAIGIQAITSDPVPEPERRPVNLDNISNVPQRSANFALRNQPVAPAPRPANQSQRAQYASMFPNDITSSVIRNQPQQQGIGSLME